MEPQSHMAFVLGQLTGSVTSLERRQEKVEKEIASMRERFQRQLALLGLWGAGLMLNLKAETVGEVAAAFLKSLLKGIL